MNAGKFPLCADTLIGFVANSRRRACRKFPRLHQLRQRPHRRAAHQRAVIAEQAFGICRKAHIAGIADRDQYIADEPVAADALDRRFCKQRAKGRVVEARQPRQIGRAQIFARGEFDLASGLREFVPRADREAIVAAVDAVADAFSKFARVSDPCSRWSGTKCSAAHRVCTARGKHWSDRCRGRPGMSRNDPCPPHRAADRAW